MEGTGISIFPLVCSIKERYLSCARANRDGEGGGGECKTTWSYSWEVVTIRSYNEFHIQWHFHSLECSRVIQKFLRALFSLEKNTSDDEPNPWHLIASRNEASISFLSGNAFQQFHQCFTKPHCENSLRNRSSLIDDGNGDNLINRTAPSCHLLRTQLITSHSSVLAFVCAECVVPESCHHTCKSPTTLGVVVAANWNDNRQPPITSNKAAVRGARA